MFTLSISDKSTLQQLDNYPLSKKLYTFILQGFQQGLLSYEHLYVADLGVSLSKNSKSDQEISHSIWSCLMLKAHQLQGNTALIHQQIYDLANIWNYLSEFAQQLHSLTTKLELYPHLKTENIHQSNTSVNHDKSHLDLITELLAEYFTNEQIEDLLQAKDLQLYSQDNLTEIFPAQEEQFKDLSPKLLAYHQNFQFTKITQEVIDSVKNINSFTLENLGLEVSPKFPLEANLPPRLQGNLPKYLALIYAVNYCKQHDLKLLKSSQINWLFYLFANNYLTRFKDIIQDLELFKFLTTNFSIYTQSNFRVHPLFKALGLSYPLDPRMQPQFVQLFPLKGLTKVIDSKQREKLREDMLQTKTEPLVQPEEFKFLEYKTLYSPIIIQKLPGVNLSQLLKDAQLEPRQLIQVINYWLNNSQTSKDYQQAISKLCSCLPQDWQAYLKYLISKLHNSSMQSSSELAIQELQSLVVNSYFYESLNYQTWSLATPFHNESIILHKFKQLAQRNNL